MILIEEEKEPEKRSIGSVLTIQVHGQFQIFMEKVLKAAVQSIRRRIKRITRET